jgi:hypothetical protein
VQRNEEINEIGVPSNRRKLIQISQESRKRNIWRNGLEIQCNNTSHHFNVCAVCKDFIGMDVFVVFL